ncbi:acetylglutamate kinase [Allomuricauda sp. SCSIO 65647]|uniref:acetylglutamate kinase n=1 Tax=Allomuricauda sp. SCSIO 65647 TaxID=2908843 RepID=UPI001F2DD337|nr:acetylglutamate kinase [Muricauda sp. SCSIO 65647]UJH66267.1 acetylglutamate kinase [Muricauda sp. SCSIO 65647]
MKQHLSILKIGGNIIEDDAELDKLLKLFAEMDNPKILVHGGGKKATALLPKLGITPKMVNGRRITDAATLDVVLMVYGGLVNKKIVAQLQALNCNAIGMSGADGNSIQAHKRPVKNVDYGFAGDVDSINADLIKNLLHLGITPIFCALTHDQKGQLLNTNADTIASELAMGLGNDFEVILYYCFEKNGVLRDISDEDSIIQRINSKSYQKLLSEGVISEGMLPKLHNGFHALNNGVNEVRIGNLALFEKENSNYTTLVL